MPTTSNGWPVLDGRTTGDLPRLRKFAVPGVDRYFLLRDGSVGFLLVHLLLWIHERLERLDLDGQPWDEWGYANRSKRGQTSGYSEHAGGDAADFNATLHPFHVPTANTFTDAQVKAMNRRLRLYLGLLEWGGNWSAGHQDAMHIQLGAVSLRQVERLARVLSRSPRGKRILEANPGLREVIFS